MLACFWNRLMVLVQCTQGNYCIGDSKQGDNTAVDEGAGPDRTCLLYTSLFGLVGDEAYGYCKNSDLKRMDCAQVANVYAKFLKQEKGLSLIHI